MLPFNLLYYDLHTHILPEVDDGPLSMVEAIEMLELLVKEGVKLAIATPHYNCKRGQDSREIISLVDKINEKTKELSLKIKVLIGNEIYYSNSIVEDLKSGKVFPLAGTRYILIEFSIGESYNYIYNGIRKLVNAGYAPIIAHIERYQCLKKDGLIAELIGLGAYIQMNISSLLGNILDKEAFRNRKLINQGLIHFISSDCHGVKHRPPLMRSAINKLTNKIDKGVLEDILINNPKRLLDNTYI